MQPSQQAGVTLIEVLTVVAIAAILATFAAPSFSNFIDETRLTSTMAQLTSDLNRARGEAIKRNSRILVCVRNAAGTGCGTGVNWKNGWLVCADTDRNGACDAATTANPNPITVHQSLNTKFTFTGSAASIRFNPNGTGGPGTLTLVSGTKSRTARIVATGNISVSNP